MWIRPLPSASQHIPKNKSRKKEEKEGNNFDLDKLKHKTVQEEFAIKLSNRFQALESRDQEHAEEEENKVENNWTRIKDNVQECIKEVCGRKERQNKKPWFDHECKEKVTKRRRLREIWLSTNKDGDLNEYKKHSKETVKTLRKKRGYG